MKKTLAILLALMMLISLLPAALAEDTVITVDASQELRTIDYRLFAAIQNQGRNGEGAADPTGQPYPGFVEAMKTMGVTVLRYPGGSMGGAIFDWREAIGPIEDRVLTYARTGNPGQILYYGVDEMAQMAEACGIPLDVCINNQMLNVEQALQYLAYLTMEANDEEITDIHDLQYWANLRAAYGHPAPYDVITVDIGNEEDGGGGWRNGKFISLSDKYTPACELTEDLQKTALYVFGGITEFEKVNTITYEDLSKNAAISSGEPNMQKRAPYVFIVDGTCHIYVDDEEWAIVDDLAACGAEDKACTVNNETGYITFGDGEHGAIPAEGTVVTISYQTEHEGYMDWYYAIHENFPGITVSVKMASESFAKVVGDVHPFDNVDFHPLGSGFINVAEDKTEFIYHQLAAGSIQGDLMAAYRQAVRDTSGVEDAELVLAAYGHVQSHLYNKEADWHLNLVEGLTCANELIGFINNDFTFAANFLLNDMPFDPDTTDAPTTRRYNAMVICRLGGDEFTITCKGWAFSLISAMAGNQQVFAEVEGSPEYTLNGYVLPASMALSTYDNSSLIPNPTGVQYIKALASKDADGNLSLLVLNNDIESDITVQVNLNGYAHNAVVSVSEYNGPEATSMNTCDEPNVVGVSVSDKELGEGDFTYTFPAHSITRFDFITK